MPQKPNFPIVNFSKIINPDFSVDYVDVTPTETTTYYVKTLSTYCEFEANDSIIVEVYHNDISVFAAHPGFVSTDMTDNKGRISI